ncbi:MAG: FGGY-family carbohydrate kinase [Propionibacteriaceae bacterium]|nr:FGGY-family carbohydrate kinase [Propionibacteriaceae bacterium]
MRVLALESSTVSAKALLYDSDSETLECSAERLGFPGQGAEPRDPDAVLRRVLALGRRHLAGRTVDLVALVSTWHGLTLQRDDGTSLTPVFEWPYAGAQPVTTALRADPGFVRWYYERTGTGVSSIYASFKLKMLAGQGVDLGAGLVMDQGSVMFQRLTGVFATTISLASGGGLLSLAADGWDREVAAGLGVGAARLLDFLPPRSWRPLTATGAAALGLPVGTPVLAPGADGGLSQLGDGTTGPGQMTFSMGTSGAIRVAAPTPVLSDHNATWCYRTPDSWLSGVATSGCGNVVDWAHDRFFGPGTGFAAVEASLRPGARDVPVFLPFLFGERCPGWLDDRRGGFAGLEPWHDTVDLYQAVLQGVVFNLRQCYEELVRLNGRPTRIVLSGGVLASPYLTQLAADALGAPLEVSTHEHSSALGAVRLGLTALGAAASGLDHGPGREIVPDPGLADYYRERFEAYLDAYTLAVPERRDS